jgi:hypothetical protein
MSYEQPKKRVFISFHMEDNYAKQLLVEQARSDKFDLEFTNFAINEPFNSRWKTQCRDRIRQVSTTICLIGPHTYTREAVLWELDTSYELGKTVFGVRIHRNRIDPVPNPLTQRNATILPWNIQSIVTELNRESVNAYPFNF